MSPALAAIAAFVGLLGGGIDLSEPPSSVTPGDDVILTVSGVDVETLRGGRLVYWPQKDVTCISAQEVIGSSRIYVRFRAKHPGQYLVWVGVCGGIGVNADQVTINVGGVPPGPDPPPPDPPPPDPPPPGPIEDAQAVIVEEAKERPPWAAMVLSSVTARRLVANRFHVIDQDTQNLSPQKQSWVEEAKGKPLPYLFIGGPDGEAVWEGPLPETEAGLLNVMRQYVKTQPRSQTHTGTTVHLQLQPVNVIQRSTGRWVQRCVNGRCFWEWQP